MFVNLLGSHQVRWFHLDSLVNAQSFQGDKPPSFSSLDRHRVARLIGQKILERHNKIRTKSPLFLTDGIPIFALQQQREKTLGQIPRFVWPNALSSHEAINGSPICATKPFKRFSCRWQITLRLQHHTPVRGSKRGYLSLSGILARAHSTI